MINPERDSGTLFYDCTNRGNVMDSVKLETYLLVCKEKSFTKAADKLFITPSAVKKQMDSLEEEVGVKLLHRSAFGCLPTPAGVVFLEKTHSILRAVRQAIDMAQQEEQMQTHEVRIGYSVKLKYKFISDVMGCHSKYFPEQTIRFENYRKSELYSALQQELIDCIFFINPSPKDFLNLPSALIGTTRAHAVFHERHPLAGHSIISAEDLRPFNLYVSSVLGQELYDFLESVSSADIHILEQTDRNDLAASQHQNAVVLYPCPNPNDISVLFDYPPMEIRLYYMRYTPAIESLIYSLETLFKNLPSQVLL